MFLRKSVWENGGDFSDPIILWYAKGIAELKRRPLNDQTSWRFLAAIHGEDFSDAPTGSSFWEQYNYYTPGEPLPSASEQKTFWNQCQHQSWYFLPWHRGYLLSLEAIVRDAIVSLGGPQDWALPYWDYSASSPNARDLPPAFKQNTLPDGSPNPLYISQRYGADRGTLPLPTRSVSLRCLNTIPFTSRGAGGTSGFGGPETLFNHGGGSSGGLESVPHNIVHVNIGQSVGGDPGLMSDPDLAGLDPIFYLHHANIDRIWALWLSLGEGRANPTDQSWLQGPISRSFEMPLPNGQSWTYAPKDVLTTEQLNYQYDPLADAAEIPPSVVGVRHANLGLAPLPEAFVPQALPTQQAELLGANDDVVDLDQAQAARTLVKCDQRMMKRSARSFQTNAAAAVASKEPDRYFLNLESIRAKTEGLCIDVSLHLDGQDVLVESLGLFGVKSASRQDLEHGGAGLTVVLDVTDELDKLHLASGIDNLGDIEVVLTPKDGTATGTGLSVERVSLYRQQ